MDEPESLGLGLDLPEVPQKAAASPYRVLARKYRPQNFSELIGQDAMVQTLANAIERGRIAHAFLLNGVRGVGKTSTARLVAKALNCIGPNGQGGPTMAATGSDLSAIVATTVAPTRRSAAPAATHQSARGRSSKPRDVNRRTCDEGLHNWTGRQDL